MRIYPRCMPELLLPKIPNQFIPSIVPQILGSIVADRAGHAMHTALVSRLLRDKSLWEETALGESTESFPSASRATAGQIV